jgi:serine/threonine-protein kinase HipA
MLDVFLHGHKAGELRRKSNGNLQFRYREGYDGPALSVSLPVKGQTFDHRACLAFFGNLLPEEDVRAQVALSAGISVHNDYHLLERFGGDMAGAVTLLPDGENSVSEAMEPWELAEEELDRVLVNLPERPLAASEGRKVRLSLAGAQSKLPVIEMDSGFAVPQGSEIPTTHILKPEPRRFPGLVANEFFCMRLAHRVGLLTSQVEKERTISGLPFLVVERYDRDLTQDPVRRLHQEDLCQALGKPALEKYQQDGGPTVAEVIRLIDEYSSGPARDRPGFWEALVFNVMIGNCDAHGKNYSLLYDSRAPRLAPLYDLVSTSIYDDVSNRLAMSINGARMLDEVDGSSWATLADQAGVSSKYLEKKVPPLVQTIRETALDLAREPEHNEDVVRDIVSGIVRRSESAL